MKKIRKIKLKEVVGKSLNVNQLSRIIGGVNLPYLGYGCVSYVCTDDRTSGIGSGSCSSYMYQETPCYFAPCTQKAI
ncbi:MAG: TIGR04149 family rSAM-modified RiPP [Tannerellaceae bacterium]|nr:TIGR04149 family rSAM-modified RiPP [Tannerellaceae bacterium]